MYFNAYNENLSKYDKIIRKYFIPKFISHNLIVLYTVNTTSALY